MAQIKISEEKMNALIAKVKKGEITTVETDPIAPSAETVPDVALGLVPVPLPKVGEIVLFKISEDPQVQRPLIINNVWSPVEVDGELLLNAAIDWAYAWPKLSMFAQLSESNRIKPVQSVMRGEGLGEWLPK